MFQFCNIACQYLSEDYHGDTGLGGRVWKRGGGVRNWFIRCQQDKNIERSLLNSFPVLPLTRPALLASSQPSGLASSNLWIRSILDVKFKWVDEETVYILWLIDAISVGCEPKVRLGECFAFSTSASRTKGSPRSASLTHSPDPWNELQRELTNCMAARLGNASICRLKIFDQTEKSISV
jgi:hypothetical protein